LTHQIDSRRTQEKEMPRAISCCAAVIDNSAQGLKERRSAVNLIDDEELANLGAQKCIGILEAPLISRTLKVKVYRPAFPHVSDLASQRRFAHLPRAEKNDSWHLPQALFDDGSEPSRDHSTPAFLTTDVNIPVLGCQALRDCTVVRPIAPPDRAPSSQPGHR